MSPAMCTSTQQEGLHLTSCVSTFGVNFLPDDGAIYANETCRSSSDPATTLCYTLNLCITAGTL